VEFPRFHGHVAAGGRFDLSLDDVEDFLPAGGS
jgi:hypothetical protein